MRAASGERASWTPPLRLDQGLLVGCSWDEPGLMPWKFCTLVHCFPGRRACSANARPAGSSLSPQYSDCRVDEPEGTISRSICILSRPFARSYVHAEPEEPSVAAPRFSALGPVAASWLYKVVPPPGSRRSLIHVGLWSPPAPSRGSQRSLRRARGRRRALHTDSQCDVLPSTLFPYSTPLVTSSHRLSPGAAHECKLGPLRELASLPLTTRLASRSPWLVGYSLNAVQSTGSVPLTGCKLHQPPSHSPAKLAALAARISLTRHTMRCSNIDSLDTSEPLMATVRVDGLPRAIREIAWKQREGGVQEVQGEFEGKVGADFSVVFCDWRLQHDQSTFTRVRVNGKE